jgi:protein FRG1
VQTLRDTFLKVRAPRGGAAKAPEVRGDATDVSFDTTLRVRMQARFKPRLRTTKEERAREKISRRELEDAAGRRLDEEEVKRLRRARREGDYHEVLLDMKVKSKHDKYG